MILLIWISPAREIINLITIWKYMYTAMISDQFLRICRIAIVTLNWYSTLSLTGLSWLIYQEGSFFIILNRSNLFTTLYYQLIKRTGYFQSIYTAYLIFNSEVIQLGNSVKDYQNKMHLHRHEYALAYQSFIIWRSGSEKLLTFNNQQVQLSFNVYVI